MRENNTARCDTFLAVMNVTADDFLRSLKMMQQRLQTDRSRMNSSMLILRMQNVGLDRRKDRLGRFDELYWRYVRDQLWSGRVSLVCEIEVG